MFTNRAKFEIGESIAYIGNLDFEVERAIAYAERNIDLMQADSVYGTIYLKKPLPKDSNLFQNEDGFPKVFDEVDIRNSEDRLILDDFITPERVGDEIEFVATNVKFRQLSTDH